MQNSSSRRTPMILAWIALALVLSMLGLLAVNRPGLTAEIGQWLPRRSLPQAVASMNSVIHNDTLYVVGGRIKQPNTVAATTAVYYAGIGPDGALGEWLQTTSLPEPLFGHAVVATDTHMYVLGGFRTDTGHPRSNVWRAAFQADGTLGAWEAMKNMPEARNFTRAVVVDNRVYVVGGYQDGGTFGEVFVADLWAGGITQWREILPLPDSVYRHALVAYNGSIYVIGGHLDKDTATVLRGTPDSQGNIGAWVPVRSLPAPRAYHAATVYNGDLVVLGGESNGAVLDTVIAAPFQADGGLGDWVALANLPQRMERFGAATLTRTGGDTIYVSGGLLGDLFYATVFASGLPPTPTPTPTATWTPTPQPPAALAVVLENTPAQWVAPGETIDYTIYYRNDGAGALESVSVDGPVPEHAELVEEAIDDGDADGHTLVTQGSRTLVRWTFSTLDAGAGGTLRYRVRRMSPAAAPIPFALAIDKDGPATAAAGTTIQYTLTVTNLVPLTVTDLLVEDIMPAGATYVGGADEAPVGDVVQWTASALGPEESRTFTFAVTAAQTVVNRLYRVITGEGASATGDAMVITRLGDTAPPPDADPVIIENAGVVARWTQDGTAFGRTSNAVRNPAPETELFMPVIFR